MENSFVRMVDEISNLSKAVKYKDFDANVRGKWNNYLNELTSLDWNVINVTDVEVNLSFLFLLLMSAVVLKDQQNLTQSLTTS